MLNELPWLTCEELAHLPAPTTHVVSVNNRLSARLKETLLQQVVQTQHAVVQLPSMLPWQAWLLQLSQQLAFLQTDQEDGVRYPLNRFAEQLQWELVLKQHETFNLKGLAKTLAQARHLQYEWDIQVPEHEQTAEYQFYQEVLSDYLEQIKKRGLIDIVQQMQAIVEAVQTGQLKQVPTHLVLLGFNELSFVQRTLFEAFQALGVTLYRLKLPSTPVERIYYHQAPNRQLELEAALQWATHYIKENPNAQLAIVDPVLQQNVVTVRRLLHRELIPHKIGVNVSVGRSLSDWPMVRAGLSFLKLMGLFDQEKILASDQIGDLLLKASQGVLLPWATPLSQFDAKVLRERQWVRLGLNNFLHQLAHYVPELATCLENGFHTLTQGASKQSLQAWIQLFKAILMQAGFPGMPINSVQYQVRQAFEETLNTAHQLSLTQPDLTLMQALSLVERLCAERLFQPQTKQSQARVDVLGLLEVEGGHWDAMWVLHLQDDILPAVPEPNPFLPKTSQHRAHAPHCTQDWEYEWASALLDTIKQSAQVLHMSWHLFEGETACQPSALLNQETQGFTQVMPIEASMLSNTPAQCETQVDEYGPPATGHVKGGSQLFEHQSCNPLWGFAQHRLGVRALSAYNQDELTALNHGTWTHKAMEELYKDLKDQQGVKDLCNQSRGDWSVFMQTVHEKVKQALMPCMDLHPLALKELEIETIARQCARFLLMECDRELPYYVVEHEKDVLFHFGALQVKGKIDRVDQIFSAQTHEPMGYLLFDYKTGTLPEIKGKWDRERIVNLQLPLYVTCTPEYADRTDVLGLGFIGLKTNHIGYAGTCDEHLPEKILKPKQDNKKLNKDWVSLRASWKQQFEQLAHEIQTGYAANMIYDVDDMKYCDIKPFLRWYNLEQGD